MSKMSRGEFEVLVKRYGKEVSWQDQHIADADPGPYWDLIVEAVREHWVEAGTSTAGVPIDAGNAQLHVVRGAEPGS